MSSDLDLYFFKFCPETTSGSIIIVQFAPTVKLISPDIYGYIEDVLDVKLCGIQLVRDGRMNPTNLVFAQTMSIINESQIAKLKRTTFKQTRVDARIIESPEEYRKTIETLADLKLSQLTLPPPISEGICYIKNFSNVDIEAKFSPFGEIISINLMDSSSNFPIRAVHFANSTSAFRAAKVLNKKSGMIVGAISLRDSRHNIIIRKIPSSIDIIGKIKEIGEIGAFKLVDKILYVKMKKLIDAQITCALLTAEDIKASFICNETVDKYFI